MLPGEKSDHVRLFMQALIDQLNYLGIHKEYMGFLAELGIEKGGIAPSVLNVGGGLPMVEIGYEHHPQGQRKNVSARVSLLGAQVSLHTVLEVIEGIKSSAREGMLRVEERRKKLLKKAEREAKKEARSDQ